MARTRLTKDQLNGRYPDEAWRRKFLDLTLLVDFLSNCVLRAKYRIPDAMNTAFRLSEYGTKFFNELTKQNTPVKEARLLCLLETVHIEPLIDVEQTDLDGLIASISEQVRSGDLLFPFIFGRGLYDKAASLFPDQRVSLNVEDTARLLTDTPQGVFQSGRFLSGPYGILTVSQERWLGPTLRIPLFSCADLNCSTVHTCVLSTDWDAQINEHRPKMTKALRRDSEDPSEWGEFLNDLTFSLVQRYNDASAMTLPLLLGDCLSEPELRLVLQWMLDSSSVRSELRHAVGEIGEAVHASAKFTAKLHRAQLMQLTMLADDETITEAVNKLVGTKRITVPTGEIRMPRVNRTVRSGRFGVQAQLGQHGIRFMPFDPAVANLRLRRLVDSLFDSDRPEDLPELEWQLRGVDSPTISAKLDHYLRIESPHAILTRLVLSSRANVIKACTQLDIDEHAAMSDAELVDTMLWKLGFPIGAGGDPHGVFWRHHERMEQVVRTAGVSPLIDQEDLRALGANYFVELEGLLEDSLAFASWTLCYDHYAAERPFTYTPEQHRSWAYRWLQNSYLEGGHDSSDIDFVEDKKTLGTLANGYTVLANCLVSLGEQPERFLRPAEQHPRFVTETRLQKFPFHHTLPFLDLTKTSRDHTVETLRNVSRVLLEGRVAEARNEQLHFRRSAADLEKLEKALGAVKQAVEILEDSGLSRLEYRRVSTQRDAWQRETYILRNPRGREVALVEPTELDWLSLPSTGARQYVVTCAQFAEPNGLLRLHLGFSSEYAHLWEGFPNRRKLSPRLSPLRAREESRSVVPIVGQTTD